MTWLESEDARSEGDASDPLATLQFLMDHLRSALDEAEILADELTHLVGSRG